MEMMFRRALVALLAAAVLGGCSSSDPGVQPGDGPANTETTYHGPVEGEPMPDESGQESAAERPPASFKEKYVYPDGLEVEITRIKLGRLTAAEAESWNEVTDMKLKKGAGRVTFTTRIRNGSNKIIEISASTTIAYGPDGEVAEKIFYDGDSPIGSLDGKLVPGKARSSTDTAVIPEQHWDDVVMEVTPDFEHGSAVFVGSVK
jgi:hypothetical protein